jgi:hypothetical protein
MNMPRLTAAIAALSIAGVAIAAYLTYVHYAGISPICTSGGCERVQGSDYAEHHENDEPRGQPRGS